MIQEAYVSFETAKLLKEKGFDGEFHKHYWGYEEGREFLTEGSFNSEYDYPAPTQQVTMRWLREVHSIFLSIQQHIDMSYVWYIYADGVPRGCDRESHNNSYEDACEAAIKYCLTNLI